jgi:hypothetical protein
MLVDIFNSFWFKGLTIFILALSTCKQSLSLWDLLWYSLLVFNRFCYMRCLYGHENTDDFVDQNKGCSFKYDIYGPAFVQNMQQKWRLLCSFPWHCSTDDQYQCFGGMFLSVYQFAWCRPRREQSYSALSLAQETQISLQNIYAYYLGSNIRSADTYNRPSFRNLVCHVYEHMISYNHNTEGDVSLCIACLNSDYLWNRLLHKLWKSNRTA